MDATKINYNVKSVTVPNLKVRAMWTSAQLGDRPELSYADERKALTKAHRARRWWIAYQTACNMSGVALGSIYVDCMACGGELNAWLADVDHVLARHLFGRSEPGNIVLLHWDCNRQDKRGRLADRVVRDAVADAARGTYAVRISDRPGDPWRAFWTGEEMTTDGGNVRSGKF